MKLVCRRISMRQYAFSPRKNKSGYETSEERGYKGLQRARVALPVWPAHQPRRSQGETSEEKYQNCWWCRDQQRACRMAQDSAEKLEHTGPAEKKGVASVPVKEQLESTVELPLPKGKGTKPSVQSTK